MPNSNVGDTGEAHQNPEIFIGLLGHPQIRIGSVTLTEFRSNRMLALLGFLAFFRGWRSRDQTADALWPNRSSESARHNLRQTMFYVRQLLGVRAIRSEAASISLDPILAFDLDDVLALQNRNGTDQEKLNQARRAVESRKGLFLESLADEWLVGPRAQIAHLQRTALIRLADDAMGNQPQQALEYLDQAIAEEPLLDGARARRIVALRKLGEHAAAKREFQSYKELLFQELAILPSPLVEEALNSKPETAASDREKSESPEAEDVHAIIGTMARGPTPQRAVELACAMTPHWVAKGSTRRGCASLALAMELARPRMSRDLFENAELCYLELSLSQGDLSETLSRLDNLLLTSKSTRTTVRAMLLCARAAIRSFKADKAQSLLFRARELAAKHTLIDEEAETLRLQSRLPKILDDPQAAEDCGREAVAAVENFGDRAILADALLSLAYSQFRNAKTDAARSTATLVEQTVGEEESLDATAVRTSLTRLREEMGDEHEIEAAYRRGVTESAKCESTFNLTVNLTYLGDYLNSHGRFREAVDIHSQALTHRRITKEQLGMATSLRGLGRAYLGLKKLGLARESLAESARLFLSVEALPGHASSLLALAQTEADANNTQLAIRLTARSMDLLRALTPTGHHSNGPDGAHLLRQAEELQSRLHAKPLRSR